MNNASQSALNDLSFSLYDSLTRFTGQMVPDRSGLSIADFKKLLLDKNEDLLPKVERKPNLWNITEFHLFQQTWGSTALGFGGMGGAAMTTANVVVVIHHSEAAVYFGGRFAYLVENSQKLQSDISRRRMADVHDAKETYNSPTP